MKIELRYSLTVICLLTVIFSFGQYRVNNLDLDGDVTAWYDQTMGTVQHPLYEGAFYRILNPSLLSHQFYGENNWSTGSIEYDGFTYDSVGMLYDLIEDVLIVRNPNTSNPSTQSIMVRQDKIEGFVFQGSTFKNLQSSPDSPINAGFYQVLFEGHHTAVVAKRMKSSKVVDTGFKKGLLFYTRSRYFLRMDEVYTPYRGKKSFYQLFPESKSEIKKYIKDNQLSFGKENEDAMAQLMSFCDELPVP